MEKIYIDYAPVAQGELMIRKIDHLPEGLKEFTDIQDGNYIVGHSETGAHHVIRKQEGVTVYANDNDPFSLYLVVNNPKTDVELDHQRTEDRHPSYYAKNGVYYIRRQWEDDGEDLRLAAD